MQLKCALAWIMLLYTYGKTGTARGRGSCRTEAASEGKKRVKNDLSGALPREL